MSDDNFIARWSRLKRQTANPKEEKDGEPAVAPETARAPEPAEGAVESLHTERGKSAEPKFDLSSLPPIEEITATTDIRAFLQSGVPADLAKAALRRAWTADPAIRDFIGLAENQWDFTDPSSIPGFGPLGPADDVRQLVAGAMGQLDRLAAASQSNAGNALQQGEAATAGASSEHQTPAQDAVAQEQKRDDSFNHEQVKSQDDSDTAAAHHEDAPADSHVVHNRRSHGGALPQ